VYGFWNYDQAVLQAPAYKHLGWRFVMLLCYRQDSWVVKPLTRVAFEGMMRLTEKIA
jgi:hypothetical protein